MIDNVENLPSEEELNLMEHFKVCFGTDSGSVVLHHLIRTNYVFDSLFSNEPLRTAYNEGKRSVILEIMRKIDSDTTELRKRMLAAYDDNTQRPL